MINMFQLENFQNRKQDQKILMFPNNLGIFLPIAFVGVMVLSLLKVPIFIYEQMKKPKWKGSNYDRRN